MTLEEIEQHLLKRLERLQERQNFEPPSFDEFLAIYTALAQVKQAIAAERIAARLDAWNASGVPVENVH